MGRYRQKTLIVEATQWWKNGDHPQDGIGEKLVDTVAYLNETPIDKWEGKTPPDAPTYRRNEGKIVRFFRRPGFVGTNYHSCSYTWDKHGWIEASDGRPSSLVCPGDWLITDPLGNIYPCSPELFRASYEKVERCDD